MTKTNSSYFYKDKPVFGLDIGFSSLKVMQIENANNRRVVSGYGVIGFDQGAIVEGVIVSPEILAKSVQELFSKNLIGNISTHRVAVAIPSTRTFTRAMKLPYVDNKNLVDVVKLETEQYIPMPIDELYLDYSIISKTDKEIELLAVAVPKKVIDSYATFIRLIGLEAAAFEPTINAGARLFIESERSDVPSILIDFGSISTDITIYDKALVVTGTVPGGGDIFTDLISKSLSVNHDEAEVIKTKYGLDVSKKQMHIKQALEPSLEQLAKEVKRMVRYYDERTKSGHKIGQIVTMGGGANLPGLSEYLTNTLRLATRMCNPWQHIEFDDLQPPNVIEKSMYVTVAGLALMNPKEIFHD